MRYVFAYAMDGTDLPCYILWPIRTEEIPSGVLMHGKVIGFNLTDAASWPLLELNNFSMPSVWTPNDPGGQPRVRRWVSRQVTLQRILISTIRTTHLLIQKAPYWRPRRWPLTKTGLTLHMRPFGIFPRAFMTSTPGSMLGGSLVTTHLASC